MKQLNRILEGVGSVVQLMVRSLSYLPTAAAGARGPASSSSAT